MTHSRTALLPGSVADLQIGTSACNARPYI
jgi:hypothetical protein